MAQRANTVKCEVAQGIILLKIDPLKLAGICDQNTMNNLLCLKLILKGRAVKRRTELESRIIVSPFGLQLRPFG